MINQYIQQYGKRLYGLCLTLCANTFDAEDLYQETWLKVVKHIAQYDTAQPFEPWLTRICVNTYRNKLRRIVKAPVLMGFFPENADAATLAENAAPEPTDFSDLHEAISRLPEKLRMTVILFYFEEMDIASAADALHIPVGTVKSRLNKARKILKEVLTDETDIRF